MIELVLPFPDKILNPNQHVHWSKKSKAWSAAREAGYFLALEKGVKLDPGKRYIVNLVFCPPDRRTRDLDNLTAACKPVLDGMCRGFGINDKMIRPLPDWGPVVKGGQVRVEILEKWKTGA